MDYGDDTDDDENDEETTGTVPPVNDAPPAPQTPVPQSENSPCLKVVAERGKNMVQLVGGKWVSRHTLMRLRNIGRNNGIFHQLGLDSARDALRQRPPADDSQAAKAKKKTLALQKLGESADPVAPRVLPPRASKSKPKS